MNTKIFSLFIKNLQNSFNLPKYQNLSFDKNTIFDELPWTPSRLDKFTQSICNELQFTEYDSAGTIADIVDRLDVAYTKRFFSEVWIPKPEKHHFTGWALVDEVNALNPTKVLDYGCGYNLFKNKIPGLIGIDPYNRQADYMVDIFEFVADPESYDVILVLGSLNFNGLNDIAERFERLVHLLKPGGKMFFRANPGIQWPDGPYVDIFPWSFSVAAQLAGKHDLVLETFKKDDGDRLYFVYGKQLPQ